MSNRFRRFRRDELGRFASKFVSRRDDFGRFAPKYVPRRDNFGRFVTSVPVRRPVPREKPVPIRRPVPREKPIPIRRPVPREKPVPIRRLVPREKSIPIRRPVPREKPVPVRRPVPREKPVPVRKPVPRKKPVLVQKPVPRKKPTLVKKPAPRKKPTLVKKPVPRKRVPVKKPISPKRVRRRRRRRPELPLVAERSRSAEVEMQEKLLALLESIDLIQSGLDMAVKTMTNRDGTVDGELRIGNLPDEWRTPEGTSLLVATLSNALRATSVFEGRPSMGGAFWASYGIRFGPQNEAEIGEMIELYKRYRGMFQIGTYPTPAWGMGALQVALTGDTVGLRAMISSLQKSRGLPPSVILIRFIWTPDKNRPGHYRGEK